MKYLISFIFICSLFNTSFGQRYSTTSKKAIKYYEQAITAFNTMDYNSVQENLNNAIKKDSNFIDAYLLKAELFRITRVYNQQIINLKKAININPEYFPFAYYDLATTQLFIGDYVNAKDNFIAYIKMNTGKEPIIKKANVNIKKCEYAITLINNPVDFKPIILSNNINTNDNQYWPSLSIDGKTMIYSTLLTDSSRTTAYGTYAHQEDFFISKKVNNKWTKGKPLGPPINTKGNEGALKLSTDGNTVVFTACNRSDGYGRCDIYFANKTSKGWSNVRNAGNMINTAYSEKQPCLSADGQILYFSSDRKDGLGEMDIWYSVKNKQGFWGKPQNMGNIINTKYSEESPFIHPDNQTFYFSSDGHLGLGQKDIFYSRKTTNNKWGEPINIGYPINTYRDEIGLFIDNTGTTAYFSSDYNKNSRNIYKFTIPQEARPIAVSFMSGRVFDKITKKPLKSNIELLNASTGELIMNVNSSKENGYFLICLPINNSYALNVSCERYLFKSIHFNFSDSVYSYISPYNQDIALEKIKINKTIVLHNIFFSYNSYELMPESTAELIKIKDFIQKNPNIKVEIGGHTDKTGDPNYNMKLSEKRAKSVYQYLINNGVSNTRLTYKGYGETKPISNTDNAKNRRTELKIIK